MSTKRRRGGVSSIASSYTIHNAVLARRPDLLRVLYQPFCIDRRGEGDSTAPPYYSTPIFMWQSGRLFVRFNPGYILLAQQYNAAPRLTEDQRDAIELFKMLCKQFTININLRAGDLQLLNNNVIVHARSAYEDHPEAAKKRHLLRLWLMNSRGRGCSRTNA